MSESSNSEELIRVPIKPYYPGELAAMYTVSRGTFRKWLEKAKKPHLISTKDNPRASRKFTILEVEEVFEHFGTPNRTLKELKQT